MKQRTPQHGESAHSFFVASMDKPVDKQGKHFYAVEVRRHAMLPECGYEKQESSISAIYIWLGFRVYSMSSS